MNHNAKILLDIVKSHQNYEQFLYFDENGWNVTLGWLSCDFNHIVIKGNSVYQIMDEIVKLFDLEHFTKSKLGDFLSDNEWTNIDNFKYNLHMRNNIKIDKLVEMFKEEPDLLSKLLNLLDSTTIRQSIEKTNVEIIDQLVESIPPIYLNNALVKLVDIDEVIVGLLNTVKNSTLSMVFNDTYLKNEIYQEFFESVGTNLDNTVSTPSYIYDFISTAFYKINMTDEIVEQVNNLYLREHTDQINNLYQLARTGKLNENILDKFFSTTIGRNL